MWMYAPGDVGTAILTASDRQITAGDIEYEPAQLKICFLTSKILILIAGDFTIHSEAILKTQRHLLSEPENDPPLIAEIYASYIKSIRFKAAVNSCLSPLGLDENSFFSDQRHFLPDFVNKITNQLQNYQGPEVEAIIAGMDDKIGHLYLLDTAGNVSCHNDVGFVAIGLGAWHAKSQLMQARYTPIRSAYATALAMIYAAKKRAEIAPGVGLETDLYLITRNGWSRIDDNLAKKIADLYTDVQKKQGETVVAAITELNEFIGKMPPPNPGAAAQPATPPADAKPTSAPDGKDGG